MNRLSNLLVDMNHTRLPDDYIISEVNGFIEELKLELGVETGLFTDSDQQEHKDAGKQDSESPPVFCACFDENSRRLCKYRNQCIKAHAL